MFGGDKVRLDDKDIRRVIIERLQSYKNCQVYEEVTVPSGKARADLVAINGHVTAYEIKSDFDSLKRLSSQITEYDLNFERNYVVVGEKYVESIFSTKSCLNIFCISVLLYSLVNTDNCFAKNFIWFEESNDIKLLKEILGFNLAFLINRIFKAFNSSPLTNIIPQYFGTI